METLNRKERIKSISQWVLINLLLIGIVFIIVWKNVQPIQEERIVEMENENRNLRHAYTALFRYNGFKDSFLLSILSDTSVSVSSSGLKDLHYTYEDWRKQALILEKEKGNLFFNDTLQSMYRIVDAIVELKSMAYFTAFSETDSKTKTNVIVDNSKINRLRRKMYTDVNNNILKEINGLIGKNSKKKDEQSVENVKGLTIVRNNITKNLKSWMQ